MIYKFGHKTQSRRVWKLDSALYSFFRGLIKAGLCKTFLHIKIRHKIKNTNPELLGKKEIEKKISNIFFDVYLSIDVYVEL